jgi:tRNA/tmRNA/rRNA uracil-C5-methylase (TrmA/RlmC/RlmD family)
VSAGSFFQSGPAAAGAIAEAVAAAAGGGIARIADLYAGVGLLGGVMAARHGAELVAVESGRSAAADARHNLRDLGARVINAQVARAAPLGPADLVIADPPRTGLGPAAVSGVAAIGAPVVVLVSCDPASLARDAGLLGAAGYRLEGVQVVDAFPGTFHVEAVSRFVPAG